MYSFKESLEKKRLERGLSMQGLSQAAGLEKGAVKNIIYERSLHPRIDTVGKLARALECSPAELLPPEWNMTGNDLNEQLMRSVMKDAMKIYVERHKVCNLDLNWYYDMVMAAYKKFSKNKMPVNDNTVYIWLDGKLDNLKQG